MNLTPRSPRPVVTVTDGELYASSLDVAAYFEKNHRHVIRDIEELLRQGVALEQDPPKFGQIPGPSNYFTEDEVVDTGNRLQKIYRMPKDGFALLAMGYTGEKALKFKLGYIAEFNRMRRVIEDELSLERRTLEFYRDHAQSQLARTEERVQLLTSRLEDVTDRLEDERSLRFARETERDEALDEKQKLANELTSARALLEDARRQMSLVEEKLRAAELQLGRRRELTG